jgi:hypothetical protein
MQAYHQYGVCSRPVCKLQKGCTRLAAASDKVYQLLAHGRWFSPGTPASTTTKTGRHDIAEILLKVALKHQKSIKSIIYDLNRCLAIIFSLFGFLASIDLLVIIDTVTGACGRMRKPYLNSNIIFFM